MMEKYLKNSSSIQKSAVVVKIVFLTFLLNACGNTRETAVVETGIQSTLAETLDAYLHANIEDTSPGMAILVVKDGEITYVGTKGMANKHTALSIQSDTGFRLASISKTFTALAVMQLIEQQRLLPDDSILQYLPEFSASWQDITIHHLLSHRSGIPDFANDFGIENWPDGVTNQDVIDYFTTHDMLEFEPGTNGEYSNTGYVLLSEIVSRLSGLSFADYLAINVFGPLGMNHSYVADEHSIPLLNEALNYAEFSTFYGLSFYITGSSGVVSSLDDMSIFLEALLNERIVTAGTLGLMQTHHTLDLMPGSDYGYGLILDPTGIDAFAHTGGNDGFLTWMLVNRDTGIRLVILGNGGDQTANHDYLTQLVDNFYDQQ